jgi:hypothetical protein
LLIFNNIFTAHCTNQYNENITVRVGSTSKSEKGYIFNIPDDKIIQHELFHPVRLNYDFAILKPTESISIKDPKVKRIKLQGPNESFEDGTSCKVSGWGKGKEKFYPLQGVKVTIFHS